LERFLDVAVRQVLERDRLGGLQPARGVRLGLGQLPVLDLLGRLLRRLPLSLAVTVDEGIGQDTVQPRLEVGPRRELVEGTVGPGEGVLDQVLGVGRVTRHPHRRGVHLVEERQCLALEALGTLLRRLGGDWCRHYRREYRGLERASLTSRRHHDLHNTAPRRVIPYAMVRFTHSSTASTTSSSVSAWDSSADLGTRNEWSASGTTAISVSGGNSSGVPNGSFSPWTTN